jgi:hypothetical protein
MTITEDSWVKYIDDLRKVNDAAATRMTAYLNTHPLVTYEDVQAAIDYGYALATKYGEAAAELACQMYDIMAELSGVVLPAAEPAATATIADVGKTINGIRKTSDNVEMLSAGIARLVKMTGVDTTMQNALRDGAEWAWIPHGDTCAFCITLASRGWQKASKKAIKGGHAEHIHANCDCTYAIRFNSDTDVDGYDPDKYLRMYQSEPGKPKDKINAMRREFYAENKEKINEQKRSAYEKQKERESSAAEEIDV